LLVVWGGVCIYIITTTSTMVKNTTGGSGAKSSARKFASSHSAFVPLPTHPHHRIAIVQKMHGPHCDVIFHDHSTSIAHIRNKFKGRHKRFNIIKNASFILVAIRDFQLNHSDILFVYDEKPDHPECPSESYLDGSMDDSRKHDIIIDYYDGAASGSAGDDDENNTTNTLCGGDINIDDI
jgi:translation initiation factor IF-1